MISAAYQMYLLQLVVCSSMHQVSDRIANHIDEDSVGLHLIKMPIPVTFGDLCDHLVSFEISFKVFKFDCYRFLTVNAKTVIFSVYLHQNVAPENYEVKMFTRHANLRVDEEIVASRLYTVVQSYPLELVVATQ